MNNKVRSLGITLAVGMAVMMVLLLAIRFARASGVVSGSCTETALDTALSGGGLVAFSCGGPKTINFTFYKQIGDNTTIDGGGVITLSGNNTSPLFQVFFGKTLTLTNITLANGYAGPISGLSSGGIENIGTLVIVNGRLVNNRTWDGGGALHNYGVAKVSNSVFISNAAEIAGGAIYNDSGGVITLTTVTITHNLVTTTTIPSYGGGIYNEGQVTMNGGGLFNNVGISPTNYLFGGGGIYNNGNVSGQGIVNFNSVTLQGNHAGFAGGMYNFDGKTTLHSTTVDSNTSLITGGGVFNSGSAAVLKVYNSQITRNSSGLGGGFYLGGSGASVVISQTRVSQNTAPTSLGGGIRNFGSLSIYQSTIDHNTALNGGGIANKGGGIYAENSTFSANQAGETAVFDTTVSLGGGIFSELNSSTILLVNVTINQNQAIVGAGLEITNVAVLTMRNTAIGDTCDVGSVFDSGGNHAVDSNCLTTTNANLKLGPLMNNGGSTPTHLPLSGSPLINGGINSGCPSVDQRGKSRPYNVTCDSGSVEFSAGDPTSFVYLPIVLK
jgi:hypothetical protein